MVGNDAFRFARVEQVTHAGLMLRSRLVVGLTGGMGGGKSTVLRQFMEAGWAGLDTDGVVRKLLNEEPSLIDELVAHFGNGIRRESDGGIDRRALAEKVFAAPDELEWLEGAIHPRVRERWMQFIDKQNDKNVMVEIPLLFEKNLEKHFDFTVCLETSKGLQLQRLAAKGITEEQARPRIQRQMPIEEKVRRADFVLSNHGDIAFLREQTTKLIQTFAGMKTGDR